MANKVPLVIYVEGKRVVIGEAEVDGDQVTATITDEEMVRKFSSDVSHFSIGNPDVGHHIVDDVAVKPKHRNVFDQDKD